MKTKEYRKLNKGFCDFCDYALNKCNNRKNIRRCKVYKDQVKLFKRKTTRQYMKQKYMVED